MNVAVMSMAIAMMGPMTVTGGDYPTVPCGADAYEANPTTRAAQLSAGDVYAKTCNSDEDWYQVAVKAGESLTVNTSVNKGQAITVSLFQPGRGSHLVKTVRVSEGVGVLDYTVKKGGIYRVLIKGSRDVSTQYTVNAVVMPATKRSKQRQQLTDFLDL